MLFGSTTPLAPDRVAELYASPEAYLDAYAAAADATVEAGFILDDDRDALMDRADPSRVAP
ncbi:MAG: alpha/beta hydrolase domain-containing protein [Polyangiaceae bacterium]